MRRRTTSGWGWLVLVAAVAMACGGAEPPAGPESSGPAGAATPAEPGAMGDRAQFDGLSFQVPAAWEEIPSSSSMRLAEYRIPAMEGDPEPGECAVFHFPGTGGSVDANLDRWYSQIQQPDGGVTAERAKVERFEASGLPVTVVEVTGTYAGGMEGGGPKPDFRMVAGVVETAAGPWFLKCTGPSATVGAASVDLRAALATAQP